MTASFCFEKYDFNADTGRLSLLYRCGDYVFEEILFFPGAPFHDLNPALVQRCCGLLHIAAGISYFKALLPSEIETKAYSLTQREAAFFETFYVAGLGQFAVENGLNLQDKIHFPFDSKLSESPVYLDLPQEALVPVGGGKDSCLTIELLRRTSVKTTLFSVNTARPIEACKKVADLPEITVRRILSPVLLENNSHFWNGHVPITGIIAFILLFSAVLYRKRYVVMSCERSANEGNMTQGRLVVNHQWSKSVEFEKSFLELTQTILPEFRYFSLLRPFSEMKIAQLFSQKCEAYFDVFTSCNHAFHLDESKRLERWCGQCDKCRFVFLMLAPFMPKDVLVRSLGFNPLNDLKQEEGYAELLGFSGHKPFECVGTAAECRLAFLKLGQMPVWQRDILVQHFYPLVQEDQASLEKEVFACPLSDFIPKEFVDAFETTG